MIKEVLLKVEKPGRYTGGEFNAVTKEITPELIRFALCFPDSYEIGMSHLGLQILYFFLNRREDTYCERAFMPWMDMTNLLKQTSTPLFAIESKDELKSFDMLGFTLQYEMSYTNVLAMLDLAGIPLRADKRGEDYPLICAGGPCAANPEPMADFIDFFYIGEGEVSLDRILDCYRVSKKDGASKTQFLESILDIPGVYVPRFYSTDYNKDCTIGAFWANNPNAPAKVKWAYAPKLDFFPDRLITPLIETVHNRVVVEIARGCMRGCRFCQAGYIYRPMRERAASCVLQLADKLIDATGHEEVSLLALSACDHSEFSLLVDELMDITVKKRVNISLPSSRIDAVSIDTLKKIQSVRKSSLTIAPEAGSQRMRDIINKNLTEDEILEGCYQAFLAGYDKIKLYFMAGLPFESLDDLQAIAVLSQKVVDTYYRLSYEQRKRPVSVSVSTACFVPKPFTPFQWAKQVSPDDFIKNQQEVKQGISKKRITYRYHDAKTAQIEGVLARGDRRLGLAIESAYKMGAVFDGWVEHFNYDLWLTAFAETGIDLCFYAHRERQTKEILPWDFIDMGIKKEFFVREWELAMGQVTTPNCREACAGCGCSCG